MRVIDAHTHWYPPSVSENPEAWANGVGETYWGKLVGRRADLKPSLQAFPSIDKILRDMDQAQVERAVILGWYWQNSSTSDALNSEIIRFVNAHSDRLSAFASVNPADSDFEIKLKNAREMGFSGVGELHDKIQGFDFLSPQFCDFCELCAKLNFPINVHLSDPRGKDYPNKALTSNSSAYASAAKNPNTKFIFAHFGGGEVFEPGFEFLENVYYDCAANTFLYKDRALAEMEEKLAKKMIFGSDYPLRLYPRKFADCEMSEFKKSAERAVDEKFAKGFFAGNFESLYLPH